MNERMYELARQADAYAWQQIDEGADYYEQPRYFAEKFAELIVQECLNQLQELVPPQVINETHQELVNSAHSYALVVSSAKIKKHFGVEE